MLSPGNCLVFACSLSAWYVHARSLSKKKIAFAISLAPSPPGGEAAAVAWYLLGICLYLFGICLVLLFAVVYFDYPKNLPQAVPQLVDFEM